MAKDPNNKKSPSIPTAPQGYDEQGDNIVGFWDFEKTPIHCIPRGAKVFDGKVQKDKPAMIIFVQLVDPVELKPTDPDADEDDTVSGEPGDLVGVWGKPGLRNIRMCCDRKVFLVKTGEQDTGKPNPMTLFSVKAAPGEKKLIPLVEDTRDKSAGMRCFLDPMTRRLESTKAPTPPNDDDDIPF